MMDTQDDTALYIERQAHIERVACLTASDVHNVELTRPMLRGRNRRPPLVQARYAVWRAMYRQWGMSLAHIGRVYNRDHSTVINGLRRADRLSAADDRFATISNAVASRAVVLATAPTGECN